MEEEVKEKVEALIKDFNPLVNNWDYYWDCPANPVEIRKDAIECALVCVKHTLSIFRNDKNAIIDLEFWIEVEKELLNEQKVLNLKY